MLQLILKYLGVSATSAFKMLPALGVGLGFKFNFLELFVTLAAGGMLGVTVFTLLGTQIREWLKRRRQRRNQGKEKTVNIRRARRIVRIWRKYGLWGIAFLTPPVISPPIGAIIAVGFREKRSRILLFMGVSVGVWSAAFALLGNQILRLFDYVKSLFF